MKPSTESQLECSDRCADDLLAALSARPGESAIEAARRVGAERDASEAHRRQLWPALVDSVARETDQAEERNAIEAELQRDLDAALAQVSTLTADLAQARAEAAQAPLLRQEIDAWQAKFAGLQADLGQARANLATRTAERDEWEAKALAERDLHVAKVAEAARYRSALELLAAASPKNSLETSDWDPKSIYRFTVETGRVARATLLAMDPLDIDAVDRAWAERERSGEK